MSSLLIFLQASFNFITNIYLNFKSSNLLTILLKFFKYKIHYVTLCIQPFNYSTLKIIIKISIYNKNRFKFYVNI